MLVSRREFLKLVLGTVPAVALSGPLSALWPEEAKGRPLADPVTLYLDREFDPRHVFLVDDLDPDKPAKEYFPPRREYFDWERLSLPERVEFWRDAGGADGATADFSEFLWDAPALEDWTAEDTARFRAFEARQTGWLNERVEIWEMSPSDLAFMTRMGPGIELFEALDPKQADALGLYEAFFGGPVSDGYGIGYRGDVETLNAALAVLGINVVLHDPQWQEEDDDDWLQQGGASA